MARTHALSFRHGEKDRIRPDKVGDQPQFLLRLTNRRLPRVFIRLDMAAAGQPKASIPMITQQNQLLGHINHHKVGDEMLGRRRWFLGAKKGRAGLKPRQRLFDLRCLQLIVGG